MLAKKRKKISIPVYNNKKFIKCLEIGTFNFDYFNVYIMSCYYYVIKICHVSKYNINQDVANSVQNVKTNTKVLVNIVLETGYVRLLFVFY